VMNGYISEWLSQELASRGWTEGKLAYESKLKRGTINNLINGMRRLGLRTCLAIAKALGVHPVVPLIASGWIPPLPDSCARCLLDDLDRAITDIVVTLGREDKRVLLRNAQALRAAEELDRAKHKQPGYLKGED
jgi:transcriptional regulator with XRE-family HTH domain